ncbi:MAG TPA: DUF5615 family PIN-like protein [Candidatus Nanoarchaeia archaeon]
MPSKKPKIQLYADECFPVPSTTYLKSLGYSVVHAYDKNFVKKSDRFHLLKSKRLGKTLITLDRDFNAYEQSNLRHHSGVIIVSVGSATPPNINKVCEKLLKNISLEFTKNSLIKVTKDKIIKIKEGNMVSEKKL